MKKNRFIILLAIVFFVALVIVIEGYNNVLSKY